MTRRKLLLGIGATATLMGVGGVAAARANQRRVVPSRHLVTLPGMREGRLVHLTDLHMGWSTGAPIIEDTLATVRDLRPDLVVMTGDYVNHSVRYLEHFRAFVARLPRPCVATLGNHDHWSGAKAIRTTLRSEGVIVLSNSWCEVKVRGQVLPVVGVDDGFTKRDDVAAAVQGLRAPERALGLSHFPNVADAMVEQGVRLVFSGHTHGGQVEVPLVTPLVSRTTGNRYLAGWYQVGDGRLYVNVGIGTGGIAPWRIGDGVAPEVACFDFE
jgi:uncharacterized protein